MAEPRMIEVAGELLKKTRDGKVEWANWGKDSFRVSFPDVSLAIFLSSGAYMLNLTNAKGEIVDRIHADIGESPGYDVLREIHELARRQVFDIDGNIDKALEYLKGDA